MVDSEVVIDGIVEAGKLLTLDTDQSLKMGMADAKATDLADVMRILTLESPEIIEVELNWGEEIARWLTEPTVSGLLLSVGMLGLMVAFYTRSVGAFTLVGFVSLALFFGGHAYPGGGSRLHLLRFVLGDGKDRLVRIPPGVAHGCTNLARQMGRILYFVDVQFSADPETTEEGRLPWDFLGAAIWEVQKG